MNNIQTFSQGSNHYARNRPRYPDELFSYLSGLCNRHDAAWDCATGNGQAAVSIADHFQRVEATDISMEQIKHGIPHPRVTYHVCPAERTPFTGQFFDLITVATAVHWFDPKRFHPEVERVLKPGGVLAVWTYGYFEIDPETDAVIRAELLEPIDRFWADGNRQVLNGYRDLSLPFEEIHTPQFSMQMDWTLEQLTAYMRTWSAVKRFSSELGTDPVDEAGRTLRTIWKDPEERRSVKMPLFLRATRKPA